MGLAHAWKRGSLQAKGVNMVVLLDLSVGELHAGANT